MTLVPFDDRDGQIWMDGRMVPWRDARVHILTHGLHYASSVFEGIRIYDGRIFKLEEHTRRLIRSAEILGMTLPYEVEELCEATMQACTVNNVTDGYIRPVVYRGSEQMGISARLARPHVAIAAWEWPRYFSSEAHERGLRLITSHWRKPAPDTAPTESKAACLYVIGTLSKHDAEERGFEDCLMLDYRGRVAEATGANIFFVKDGAVKTPIADCFLNGITRQTVIQLCRDLGIPLEETVIMPEDLASMDECFITGTAAEVTPVGTIDSLSFTVGPTTKRLKQAYEDLVHGRPIR